MKMITKRTTPSPNIAGVRGTNRMISTVRQIANGTQAGRSFHASNVYAASQPAIIHGNTLGNASSERATTEPMASVRKIRSDEDARLPETDEEF
ncbi:hypothetical protein FHS27_003883 [Rhodopirellula rubra]|uniref:Uncharacterized protein n=1 Tax=Aporhodopirellula rubra TaxID=980271 RepID=A0A7W5H7K4_9BACT|nr:hypothetical protein [Aporhodopirellula rubra]MBB3208056.1 hypothetical protein [Aporhodopirellula rubra]